MKEAPRACGWVCVFAMLVLSPAVASTGRDAEDPKVDEGALARFEDKRIELRETIREMEMLLDDTGAELSGVAFTAETAHMADELRLWDHRLRRIRGQERRIGSVETERELRAVLLRLRRLGAEVRSMRRDATRLADRLDSMRRSMAAALGRTARVGTDAPAGTGAIQGRVTDFSSGAGIETALVNIYDANGAHVMFAYAIPNGWYTTDAVLDTGTYYAVTENWSHHIDELYDDIRCPGGNCDPTTGTAIWVDDGIVTMGVDFALDRGGVIAGTVTDSTTGSPLDSVRVDIFYSSGELMAGTTTSGDGSYEVGLGLPTGTYFAATTNSIGYVNELYDDFPCPGGQCDVTTGTPISVVEGDVRAVTQVDFALSPGGTLEGHVTDAVTGGAIAGGYVKVYDGSGDYVSRSWISAGGVWRIDEGLPAGDYFARTTDTGYVDELYDDVSCPAWCDPTTGTPISLTPGVHTSGIDFALDPGGAISGTVTDSISGAPLVGVALDIYDAAGQWMAWAETDALGFYMSSSPLGSGDHFVLTYNEQRYFDELWDDIPCPGGDCDVTTGTPVPVTVGATTENVDFALDKGGSISGVVTGSVSDAPLEGIGIDIYDAAGDWVTYAESNGAGEYVSKAGLQTGSYFLVTYNDQRFLNEVWDDHLCFPGCDPTGGDPVPVTVGVDTPNIDFVLDPGGAIAGTVTDAATGAPITNGRARIFTSGGSYVTSGYFDELGEYLGEAGLIAGDYFVKTRNYEGYVDELYDDISCPSSRCDPTLGTPVTVAFGSTTGFIDFALDAGGHITGTVTDPGLDAPIPGVNVNIYDDLGDFITDTVTDETGAYMTGTGLPTGDYFADTWNDSGYVDELYDDIPCVGGCDPTTGTLIPVTLGATTPGIDFVLEQGGGISGTITDAATGSPLYDVEVTVYDLAGNYLTAMYTDMAGFFETTTALPSGDFVAATYNGDGYLNELWDDILCHPDCDVTTGVPIPVAAGVTTAGVDFALDKGGAVSGTVTANGTGAPVTNGRVNIYDSGGGYVTRGYLDGSGFYTSSSGLLAGTYYARVYNDDGYIDELWDDIPCTPSCTPESGTPISVTVGTTTTGIDFALDLGGSIEGTITDAGTGAPLDGQLVNVYDAAGDWVTYAYSDALGNYVSTRGLPSGTYFARTRNDLGMVDELWDDIPCLVCDVTTGTPIVVTLGTSTAGIDFALIEGGAIAGTITHAGTGAPLDDQNVHFYDVGGNYVTYAYSDALGNYVSNTGLPSGTYFARTWNDLGLVDELWDDIPCDGCDVTTGTPFAVTQGTTTGGVDFALAEGGVITGTVTDGTTDAPLEGISVTIYNSDGSYHSSVSSDATGTYVTDEALMGGTYYARTYNDQSYLNELYDGIPCPFYNSCDVTTGTPVPVTLGATTTGIDFELDMGGAISGSVHADGTMAAIADGKVDIYDTQGKRVTSGYLDAAGEYRSNDGLPAGTYFAIASNNEGYVNELFDGIVCPGGACDPTAGTPIPVAVGVVTPGIDFGLAVGGTVSGAVTDAVTGAALLLTEVDLVDAAGNYVAYAYSNGSGGEYFVETGLPTGTYYARTWESWTGEYVNELYDDIPCPYYCDATTGTPIAVVAGATTAGIDFQLAKGGLISGQVTDAGTGAPIDDSWVVIYDAAGNYMSSGNADAAGIYTTLYPMPAGDFYAHVFNDQNYVNELWDDIPCNYRCEDPSVGVPITVVPETTVPGIDFALGTGGTMSGTLTDAGTGAPITMGDVEVYDAAGTYRGRGLPDGAGGYTTYPGLFTDVYFVRTDVRGDYVEELWDDIQCPDPGCDPTLGDPISVTLGSNTPGIDFELDFSIFHDGFESGDISAWSGSNP